MKNIFLTLALLISFSSFGQKSKGFIACGIQVITHMGGDMSKASYSEIADISDLPALVAYIDNTSAISIVIEAPSLDIDYIFSDIPLIRSYRVQDNTYYSYISDTSPSFTVRFKNKQIVEFIMALNDDRSFSFVNNCSNNIIIDYYKNNPEKAKGLKKL